MDLKRKRELYNACDPFRTLGVDDTRIVDLDNLKDKNGKSINIRGEQWAHSMFTDFAYSDKPICKYFSGYTGSGKTTELKRLEKMLTDNDYFPVYIDSLDFFDLSNEIDAIDIHIAIIYSVMQKIAIAENKDSNSLIEEENGYFSKLVKFLSSDVSLEKINVNTGVAKFVFNMKQDTTLRRKIRTNITDRISTFKTEIFEEFEKLNERAKKINPNGLVVIVDSLEKLAGTSSNWDEVVKSAERVFDHQYQNISLPVHSIYTAPTFLVTKGVSLEFLPVIKVRSRKEKGTKEGEVYDNGVDALHSIIKKRVDEDALKEIFGKNHDADLREIILFCGGLTRDILKIMQKFIKLDNFPATKDDKENIFAGVKNHFKDSIFEDDYAWLREVAKANDYITPNDEKTFVSERMFKNHVILRYRNHDRWYDLHPAVKEILSSEE